MTGSGKTLAAMMLLAPLPRVVCVDLKGSDTVARFPWEAPSRELLRRLERGDEARVVVRDHDEALYYMGAAYAAGGCIVYIDEVYMLIPPRTPAPDIINKIWTTGRELGVGGWCATQRPTWLPLWLLSEANWLFAFRLRLADDRKRMSEYMGEEVLSRIPDKYGFYVGREDWQSPAYYSHINASIQTE